MTMRDANKTCDSLIAFLRHSGLNFLVQETPFSAFLTIRKTFCRGSKTNYNDPVIEDKNEDLEKLRIENETFRTLLEDKDCQLKKFEEESAALQNRLEKAEEEMLINFKNAKITDEKLRDEIFILKSVIKKSEGEITSLKSKYSEAAKTIKVQGKNIHNLENKNENLISQVTKLKEIKNDAKKENVNLANEIKVLKTKTTKVMQSKGTQADPQSSLCSCFNHLLDNNNATTVSSSTSISTQTCLPPSDSDVAPTVSTFSCLVCSENFGTADELMIHAGTEHDLSIDPLKLTDPDEKDDFLKFLKSMNIDGEYLEYREKFYPENSDHIHKRIKIRIIAQMQFASWSRTIERNMEENNFKSVQHRGKNLET